MYESSNILTVARLRSSDGSIEARVVIVDFRAVVQHLPGQLDPRMCFEARTVLAPADVEFPLDAVAP